MSATKTSNVQKTAEEYVSKARTAAEKDPVAVSVFAAAVIFAIVTGSRWPGLVLLGGLAYFAYALHNLLLPELRRIAAGLERTADAQARSADALGRLADQEPPAAPEPTAPEPKTGEDRKTP